MLKSLTDQAGLPHPLGGTVTLEPVNQVLAGAPVVAGVRSAVVHIWDGGIGLVLKIWELNTCSRGVFVLMVQEGPLQPGAH